MPLYVYDQNATASINNIGYRKFGENPDAPIGSEQLIWPLGGDPSTYVWPTSAATITISSDNAGDTGMEILIQGIGADGAASEEVVAVGSSSTSLFFRVYRMIVTGAASNLGLIEAKHSGDTLACINTGDSQTQQLFGTVPANKVLLVSGIMLALGVDRGATFRFWVKDPTTPFKKQGSFYIQDTSVYIPINPYAKIGAFNDWYISAEMTAKGAVSGQLFGFLAEPRPE